MRLCYKIGESCLVKDLVDCKSPTPQPQGVDFFLFCSIAQQQLVEWLLSKIKISPGPTSGTCSLSTWLIESILWAPFDAWVPQRDSGTASFRQLTENSSKQWQANCKAVHAHKCFFLKGRLLIRKSFKQLCIWMKCGTKSDIRHDTSWDHQKNLLLSHIHSFILNFIITAKKHFYRQMHKLCIINSMFYSITSLQISLPDVDLGCSI